MRRTGWRAYLLGLAGGVMVASAVGDVPLWAIIPALLVITWDVAGVITDRIFANDREASR